MFVKTSDGMSPEDEDRMRHMFGPQHVDFMVRQAIQCCWMALPSDRKNVDEVEKQVRRVLDRALKDFREDTSAFGLGE